MKTPILREEFTKELLKLNGQLEPKEKSKIAVELNLNAVSVHKYMRGEIANLETAELIILEANKLIQSKQPA